MGSSWIKGSYGNVIISILPSACGTASFYFTCCLRNILTLLLPPIGFSAESVWEVLRRMENDLSSFGPRKSL